MNFTGCPTSKPRRTSVSWPFRLLTNALLFTLLVGLSACSSRRSVQPANSRPFAFETDTFAYANELVWIYYYDDEGEWKHSANEPKPDYTHHCYVVARSARQFFQYADFDASLPKTDHESYHHLIKQVIARDPSRDSESDDRVVIPGYADLREFSTAHEQLLKDTCGKASQSYFQRGNWRMIFPFSRSHQEKEAEALATAISNNRSPVVHLLTFPKIKINHAILLFDVDEEQDVLRFAGYDPNNPEAPVELTFDRKTRTFDYPVNDYFKGGKVDVYQIYRNWNR